MGNCDVDGGAARYKTLVWISMARIRGNGTFVTALAYPTARYGGRSDEWERGAMSAIIVFGCRRVTDR